jgi:hypothetical protein
MRAEDARVGHLTPVDNCVVFLRGRALRRLGPLTVEPITIERGVAAGVEEEPLPSHAGPVALLG